MLHVSILHQRSFPTDKPGRCHPSQNVFVAFWLKHSVSGWVEGKRLDEGRGQSSEKFGGLGKEKRKSKSSNLEAVQKYILATLLGTRQEQDRPDKLVDGRCVCVPCEKNRACALWCQQVSGHASSRVSAPTLWANQKQSKTFRRRLQTEG